MKMDTATVNVEMQKRHFDQEKEWNRPVRANDEERAWKIMDMVPRDAFSILEVGCGNGLVINKIEPSIFAVGLDFSRIALTYLNREKVIGNCANLPFGNKSFDLIIAAELLEHLDDETLNETLAEFQRVAKRYILTSVPFQEEPWVTFVKCADCGCAYSPYGHQQYFDEQRVRSLVKGKWETVEFCGKKKMSLLLRRFLQSFLGIYPCSSNSNSICPRCSSNHLKYGRLAKFLRLALATAEYGFARIMPDTILCLYRLR